jgi:RNA polymerase sigma factor (sigma-70 family)
VALDQIDKHSLLLAVANGDELAFGRLFDIFSPSIHAIVYRITGNEWTVEEVLQDIFVKVWINRATLPTIENFDGWLYTVAKNTTYNAIKQSQREKLKFNELAKESITLFYPEADYNIQEREFQAILEQAIERLPEKQKLTYKLIKEEQLKREQVATQLNIAPETVKSNLDHAMRSIRAYCVAHLKDLPLILILHFSSKYF